MRSLSAYATVEILLQLANYFLFNPGPLFEVASNSYIKWWAPLQHEDDKRCLNFWQLHRILVFSKVVEDLETKYSYGEIRRNEVYIACFITDGILDIYEDFLGIVIINCGLSTGNILTILMLPYLHLSDTNLLHEIAHPVCHYIFW